MNEYILIFRHTPVEGFTPSLKQQTETVQHWQKWIGEIAAQVKFVSTNRIGFEGAVVQPSNEVIDGFYQDSTTNEAVSGNMIVKSDSLSEATEIAKGCPILAMGGTVEVRNLIPMKA